jgi:hypothetical protein
MYYPLRRVAVGSSHRPATARLLPLALAFGLLSACNAPHPGPDTVIIAATATANEPAPVLSAHIHQILRSAGTSYDATAYVVDPATGQLPAR